MVDWCRNSLMVFRILRCSGGVSSYYHFPEKYIHTITKAYYLIITITSTINFIIVNSTPSVNRSCALTLPDILSSSSFNLYFAICVPSEFNIDPSIPASEVIPHRLPIPMGYLPFSFIYTHLALLLYRFKNLIYFFREECFGNTVISSAFAKDTY